MAESKAAPTSRLDRLRSRFRLLWLAPVLALVALVAWSLASPMGAAPDDDYHLASIWCANPLDTASCAQGAKPDSRVVPKLINQSACYAQNPERSASCQAPLIAHPTTIDTDRGNFLGQYPPVYYAVMSVLVSPNILASVFVMRLLNILLFVGITTALCLLLPASRRPALIGGWLIATVPLGAFLLASNNPSSWALIGVGSAWLALIGYFETTGRRRVGLGVLFGVTAIMAAGARTDAAIYTVIGIALAIWLTFKPDRRYLLAAILPVALAIIAVVFYATSGQSSVGTGGLGTGGLQPTTPTGGHAPRSGFGLIAYNLLQVPTLWVGAFGQSGLGWLDTSLPAIVWVASAGVFAAVVFSGLLQNAWRKAVAVLGLAFVLWVLPTYILTVGGNVVGENVQSRYLLPLILVLGMLALLPAGTRVLQFSGLQFAIIGGALAIANGFALFSNIRRYVTGVDVASVNLDAGAEWSWPGTDPMAIWIIGTLAYAGLLAVLGREVVKRGHYSVR